MVSCVYNRHYIIATETRTANSWLYGAVSNYYTIMLYLVTLYALHSRTLKNKLYIVGIYIILLWIYAWSLCVLTPAPLHTGTVDLSI